ncbi:MAG: acetoin utilization protein AcuC [Anaerolineales bacterium]
MRRAVFLSSPELWQRGHGPQHPLKPERLRRTYELLEEYGALAAPNVQVVQPRLAEPDELALFHTPDYIRVAQALSSGELTLPAGSYGFGPGDNPIFTGMYKTEALKVGSALQAADLLYNGDCDVAFSYSGGLHHAGPDFASGFCVFNDCAVAIQWLLDQGLRVAYIDIDVHHGDGVQNAFYDSDRVLTISLHQDPRTLFPGTGFVDEIGRGAGTGYSINVPLPPLTFDAAYLRAFEAIVPPLLRRFSPDIVASQLGVDTHYTDPLANLALTTQAHLALFQALDGLSPRWLAFGGGGYAIDLVPRSWALAFGVMSGQQLPEELPTGYQQRYGGSFLHDAAGPQFSDALRMRTSAAVDGVIAQVKLLHSI